MFNRKAKALTSVIAIAVISVGAGLAQNAPKQKNVKDEQERDLFTKSLPATTADPNQRLAALNSWKEKYPESEFKEDRLLIYLSTYQQLNQPAKMWDTAKEILAVNPQEINALMWLTLLTESLPPTPETLSTGEKAAQSLLTVQKPAAVTDEATWKKMQTSFEAAAHKTLGFVANQRKQFDVAEQEYGKSLAVDPTQAAPAYGIATAILGQKKPERSSEALFYLARAASLPGPGALPAPVQKQVDAFLVKSYTTYHGQDEAGLKELRQLAVANPKPPAGFKIKNVNEIQAEKEEQLAKDNPQLALWKNMKDALIAANGEQYWESGLKGSEPPKMRGKIVSTKPETRPKEVLLDMDGDKVPDVTLKFETALPGKADPGTEIQFVGVASSYTKEPFMITFDTEKEKIEGWPAAAGAPARKGPATKKGAATKKKG